MPDFADIPDSQLAAEALAGSEEAYREIVLRFERPVLSLILRIVRDRELAEDLAQDAFVKAFAALDHYVPEHKLSSWLFKIAHNTAIDQLRRRRIATVPLDAAGGDDSPSLDPGRIAVQGETPEETSSRRDLARLLDRALERLRPEYREIVVLRYREGLAYNEIADVVGLPLGTVKTHLHRARKQLASVVRGLGFSGV